MRATLWLCVAACCAAAATAMPLLSNVFDSHMVLQQAPASAKFWGWAPAGALVTVADNMGNHKSVAAPASGPWIIEWDPVAGGFQTYDFQVSCPQTGQTVSLTDVVFGEVFLCGGQSNMQMTVGQAFNASQEESAANDYPFIRLFTVGQGNVSSAPLQTLASIVQSWTPASAQSVGGSAWVYFSAACWFFGRDLFDGLLGAQTPVGLISSNWGGTIVQAWMPADAIAQCNATEGRHARIAEHNDAVAFAADAASGVDPNQPSVLYNAMIVPFAPMALGGAVWYQGEANTDGSGGPQGYTCLFRQMIAAWRRLFGFTFPFVGVQLAPWNNTASTNPSLVFNLAEMRQAQLVALVGTNLQLTSIATAADLGDPFSPYGNIHPRDKQTVGARLALQFGCLWGVSNACLGPIAIGAKGGQDGVVEVVMTETSGLALRQFACPDPSVVGANECAGFELGDESGTFVPADAAVGPEFGSLLVSSSAPVPQGGWRAVRYGWRDFPQMTVVDAVTGLPAFPFYVGVQNGQ